METKDSKKYKFIFPEKIADAMNNVDTKTQLEATMLSMSFIMIGLFLLGLHQMLFIPMSWIYKCLIGFNMVCGFVLLSTYLITSYQQWRNHLEMMQIDPIEEKRKIKLQGNIFVRIVKAFKRRREKKEQMKKEIDIRKRKERRIIESRNSKDLPFQSNERRNLEE